MDKVCCIECGKPYMSVEAFFKHVRTQLVWSLCEEPKKWIRRFKLSTKVVRFD